MIHHILVFIVCDVAKYDLAICSECLVNLWDCLIQCHLFTLPSSHQFLVYVVIAFDYALLVKFG